VKKVLPLLAATMLVFSAFTAPSVMAKKDDDPPTAILTDCGQAEDGIMCILELVIDIMTIGVGILGVIGITVVGIQYLTAGGNEEKTRKSKTRMFEIIIGLVAYALIYTVLKWLLPGFGS